MPEYHETGLTQSTIGKMPMAGLTFSQAFRHSGVFGLIFVNTSKKMY
jgi:hypothetical protein